MFAFIKLIPWFKHTYHKFWVNQLFLINFLVKQNKAYEVNQNNSQKQRLPQKIL